jgi:hypothetical protein
MSRAKLGDDDDKDRVFDYKALESKIYPKRGSLDQKSLIKCGYVFTNFTFILIILFPSK